MSQGPWIAFKPALEAWEALFSRLSSWHWSVFPETQQDLAWPVSLSTGRSLCGPAQGPRAQENPVLVLSLPVCFVVPWLVQFAHVDFVLQLDLLFCEGEGRGTRTCRCPVRPSMQPCALPPCAAHGAGAAPCRPTASAPGVHLLPVWGPRASRQ